MRCVVIHIAYIYPSAGERRHVPVARISTIMLDDKISGQYSSLVLTQVDYIVAMSCILTRFYICFKPQWHGVVEDTVKVGIIVNLLARKQYRDQMITHSVSRTFFWDSITIKKWMLLSQSLCNRAKLWADSESSSKSNIDKTTRSSNLCSSFTNRAHFLFTTSQQWQIFVNDKDTRDK